MAISIHKIARMNEFRMELSSLGQVTCVSLNTSHLSTTNKKLAVSGVQSLDVVRRLFGEMVRRPVVEVFDNHDSANSARFTTEELATVTGVELEAFAEKLINKNKYILLKTHKGSDIERSIDESVYDFIVRAFRHYATEEKAAMTRTIASTSHSLLASTTVNAMQRALGISDQHVLRHYAEAAAAEQLIVSASNALSASASVGAMQQSALDAIVESNRYVKENSASVASALYFKHEQDTLRGATFPLQSAQHYLDQSTTSALLAKTIYRNEDLIRDAALGQERRATMSAVITTELQKQQQLTRDLLISHETMFRLPQAFEATRLLDSYQLGAVAEFAQGYAKDIFDRQHSFDAITTPWLSRVEAARSVAGILELQGMGKALRTAKGFDLELTAALRLDLGDWRDRITFPESVFIDPVARTDFYVDRGFNTALTDFPESAFRQNLEFAGLDGEALDFEFFGQVVQPSTDPEEEAGLQRTNKCHDRLQRFERQLREFIDEVMSAQYGADWPRKRLAPKLYEDWEFKKRRAESNGLILTFMDVADFTDYETIICKQDHWREVFESRFKKKESVRESLQRLQPIRLAAMHARIVTKEDELYLIAEVVRLISAIR
ncbi:MAG: Swt1 family HEPN domain-containing protein [Burkholderiaceae bacterium]|nr:Swt1 family HEPN domain-containing protein [Burkholderiaceae bacterium]